MTNLEFYNMCADILNTEHLGEAFKYKYRTRWNNRSAGQGRFRDCGIIRCFGSKIHIALTHPKMLNVVVDSKQHAIEILKSL